MAVTDPNARPHQCASMFIAPADAPGVHLLRDVPTMGHPQEAFGRLGGHAEIGSEIVYENVRVPADALLGGEGKGFLIAQHRLGPGRIHRCMRRLGAYTPRVRHALRARDVPLHARKRARRHATVQNWIADSAAQIQAARLITLHAAWIMDAQGPAAARTGIAIIKYYDAQVLHDVVDRALQASRLARILQRPAAVDATYRAARAARI